MNKILIIGACGQIGTELTEALRKRYGTEKVLAADIEGADVRLNVLDKAALQELVTREGIGQIYHLAALLSAKGELFPAAAWDLNMQGLLQVLEVARTEQLRVFWPSSIAVFGADSPRAACPQQAITSPAAVYGISKVAGELWCRYYHQQYGVDVRSLRFPGLISSSALPGGGTTDYAVAIFHEAVRQGQYTCFLKPDATLPMMYMPDAVRAAMELMDAPEAAISIRRSYNLAAMSFSPRELAAEISRLMPGFQIAYRPDFRQTIAESWPTSILDLQARRDWGWKPRYDLRGMCSVMLENIKMMQQQPHCP
jgi:nucleoside-diphosphate-sugar epimerase